VTEATPPEFVPADKFYVTDVAHVNGRGNGIPSPAATPASAAPEVSPHLKPTTPREVLQRWKTSGPLVHEQTGFAVLDERTGGGLVHGSRVYVLGSPDAGKTAFVVHLIDAWARKGVIAGLLAVDEEDDDVVTRQVQRLVLPPMATDLDMDGPFSRERFTRQDCERRVPHVVEQMEQAMGDPPIRFYNAEWTIEAAAADLDKFARSLNTESHRRAVLLIDSIQTVTCAALMAATREPSPREAINANVKAVRAVASKYGMLVVATSEMNRNAYRDVAAAEEANDMAAGKESGAIEYSGRLLVSLRSVKDDPDLVLVRLPKNKHGPAWRRREDDFYLRIDRATQTLSDAVAPVSATVTGENGARSADRRVAVLKLIEASPGRGTKALRQLAKDAGLKIGNDALDATLEDLLAERAIEDRGTASAHKFHGVPEGAGHPSGTGVPGVPPPL
jgi:DnaB-like helicase C terminal domain